MVFTVPAWASPFSGLLRVLAVAAALAVTLAASEGRAQEQEQAFEETAPQTVTYDGIFATLSPYGQWFDDVSYGRIWQPDLGAVGSGFQPYSTSGRWLYSQYGWTWDSDFEWGWLAFHYGRWFVHPTLGWVWLPDLDWSPGWVDWRTDDDYVGWAPRPPMIVYNVASSTSVAYAPVWIVIPMGGLLWPNPGGLAVGPECLRGGGRRISPPPPPGPPQAPRDGWRGLPVPPRGSGPATPPGAGQGNPGGHGGGMPGGHGNPGGHGGGAPGNGTWHGSPVPGGGGSGTWHGSPIPGGGGSGAWHGNPPAPRVSVEPPVPGFGAGVLPPAAGASAARGHRGDLGGGSGWPASATPERPHIASPPRGDSAFVSRPISVPPRDPTPPAAAAGAAMGRARGRGGM